MENSRRLEVEKEVKIISQQGKLVKGLYNGTYSKEFIIGQFIVIGSQSKLQQSEDYIKWVVDQVYNNNLPTTSMAKSERNANNFKKQKMTNLEIAERINKYT